EIHKLAMDYSPQQLGAAAGQLWAFIHELKVGDTVIVPDTAARRVLVGVLTGEYRYDPSFNPHYLRTRTVDWKEPIDWDLIAEEQRRSFFGLRTIYRPNQDLSEIIHLSENTVRRQQNPRLDEGSQPNIKLEGQENLYDRAEEAVRTRLAAMNCHEFQDFVGAVLKAAGFVVLFNSARKGRDGGIDLIISRDSLGAGEKIIVQVKHQAGAVGQPELQQLIGTLKSNEHGLMVSTGGITADAQHFWRGHRDRLMKPLEARAFIQLLGDVYDRLDPEFKARLPLRRAYVPAVAEE
ncbi:MAG: restriction endonuclease, partial [Candidatus Korobacteraceae bacterium]